MVKYRRVNWNVYGYCATCNADPGGACKNLRYTDARSSHPLYNDTPHRGRTRLTVEQQEWEYSYKQQYEDYSG